VAASPESYEGKASAAHCILYPSIYRQPRAIAGHTPWLRRRGQRPQVWVDFEEERQTMIKWSGYKIIGIIRT